MQLNTMDCTGRSNLNERDSELGDDMVRTNFEFTFRNLFNLLHSARNVLCSGLSRTTSTLQDFYCSVEKDNCGDFLSLVII